MMTVLIQLEVIREKGHWIAGGNLAFPVLLAILLWWPSLRGKNLLGYEVEMIASRCKISQVEVYKVLEKAKKENWSWRKK